MQPAMAPEVAEQLGGDADRYLAEAAVGIGSCRDCSRPVDVAEEPSSLVLLVSSPDTEPGKFMTLALTHATCSPSEVRQMPRAEIESYLLSAGHPIGSVSAMSGALQAPGGPVRPVLFVSNHGELTTITEQGAVDSSSAELFAAGWEMVMQIDSNPIARSDTRVRFTASGVEGAYISGRLLIGTGTQLMADLDLLVHPLWMQLVLNEGEVAVYAGRLSVQHWTAGIDYDRISRAISAGVLAGCMLPAEIRGI